MTTLSDALSRIVSDLTQRGVRFALIGGLAVSARSEPRFTRDLDLALSVRSDDEAQSLVRSLMQDGYEMLGQIEHDVTARLAAVRVAPPGDGPIIDLMFASSGIEPETVFASEELEI